jgi:PiT family inorganic phosphate transporter
MTITIILLILLALFFDFLNGFHDAANSIATIVATRVLSPRYAVLWAGFFNFLAFFIFSHTVASTLGKGIIDINIVDPKIIMATLVAACAWNLITWYFGLPTSSSHALMGGLVGAALVKVGASALIYKGIIRTVMFIVIAPVLGLILGAFLGIIVHWIARKKTPMGVDDFFRKAQLFSAAAYSLGHGGNDAQKTMGIMASLLFSAGVLGNNFYIPNWVAISCYAAIAIGTLSGGWRIVKTMGQKITKLRPVDGFCAEFGAAISLFTASAMGVPVSTTHTITGSIVGTGLLRRVSAVKWAVAGQIVWAWIITIPAGALISALTYYLVSRV